MAESEDAWEYIERKVPKQFHELILEFGEFRHDDGFERGKIESPRIQTAEAEKEGYLRGFHDGEDAEAEARLRVERMKNGTK